MDDLEQQIRAWADAVAPIEDLAAEVEPTEAGAEAFAPGRNRGRWLAAAAVVVAVSVGAALVVRAGNDGPEQLRVEGPAVSTTTAPVEPVAVPFRVVGESMDGSPPGELASAQDAQELGQVLTQEGVGRLPEVDYGTSVVVAFTIRGLDCPDTMSSMPPILSQVVRTGSQIEPRFLDTPPGCEPGDVSKSFFVVLPWERTGDAFELVLPADLAGSTEARLAVERRPGEAPAAPPVTSSLELEATEVPAGGTLRGTVTVDNQTGQAIEGTTCGDYFIAALMSDQVPLEIARADCLTGFTIPEGTSTYPVEVTATYRSCTTVGDGSGPTPRCAEGNALPPLPAGVYQLVIDDPQHLVPAIDLVWVTVT